MWKTKAAAPHRAAAFCLCGTIWNALRVALGIFSGRIILNFGIQKRLRAFLNPIFTDGVVTENGICSALALSVTFGASSPKGRAKYTSRQFLVSPKALATSFTAWLSLRESWRGSA